MQHALDICANFDEKWAAERPPNTTSIAQRKMEVNKECPPEEDFCSLYKYKGVILYKFPY